MTHRTHIDKWPTLSDFASDIGVPENTAKQMRTRDSINSKYWVAMVAAARKRRLRGVSFQALAESAFKGADA